MRIFFGLALLMLLTFSGVSLAETTPSKSPEVSMKFEKIGDLEHFEVYFLNGKEIARQKYALVIEQGMIPIEKLIEMSGQIPDGIAKSYYPGGALMMEIPFVNNSKNGKVKRYDENGALMAESTYVEGKITGSIKRFYANGALKAETNLDGSGRGYYQDGSLKLEMDIGGDVFNLYDEKGNILPKENFNDRAFMKKFLE